MTVTRHPTGQDLMCLVCLKPAQDIDHVVNRGSGGSKERDVPENKVPLCRECHELKTQGYINTEIKWAADGRVYRWQRRLFKDNEGSLPWIVVPVEVSQRYKCLVLSAAAEAAGGEPRLPPPKYSILQSGEKLAAPDDGSSAAAPSAGLSTKKEVMPNGVSDTEMRVLRNKPRNLDQREVGRDGQVLSDGAEDGTAKLSSPAGDVVVSSVICEMKMNVDMRTFKALIVLLLLQTLFWAMIATELGFSIVSNVSFT